MVLKGICFKCSSNSIMIFRSNSVFKNTCSAFSARSEKFIRQFPSNKGCDSVDKQLLLLHNLTTHKALGFLVVFLGFFFFSSSFVLFFLFFSFFFFYQLESFFFYLYCIQFLLLIACDHFGQKKVSCYTPALVTGQWQRTQRVASMACDVLTAGPRTWLAVSR